MQSSFERSSHTLEDKLLRMENAYLAANSFVRFEDGQDLNAMQATIHQLSPEQRAEWGVLWKDVADANEQINIPPAYLALLDEVHQATWDVMKPHVEKHGDVRNIGFGDRVAFMQAVADAQTVFWQNRFPDVFQDFKGTRVEGFHHEGGAPDQYSLEPDTEAGRYYYRVSDRPERFDVWTHVSAHEPQHSIQMHLIQKLKGGMPLPPPLRDAAKIFVSFGKEGVGNLRPALVCGEDGRSFDDLGYQVGRTYEKSPHEDTARYQGFKMEHAMETLFPSHDKAFSHDVR